MPNAKLVKIAKLIHKDNGWKTRIIDNRLRVYDTWTEDCLENYHDKKWGNCPNVQTFKQGLDIMNRTVAKQYRLKIVGTRLTITDWENGKEVFGESISDFVLIQERKGTLDKCDYCGEESDQITECNEHDCLDCPRCHTMYSEDYERQ